MLIARNPHVSRSMIRSLDGFFGRRREVVRAAQRLSADSPQSIAITGDRRIGKSSFMWHISQPDIKAQYLEDPDKTVFVFMDFQEDPRPSVESFFSALLQRLQDQLVGRMVVSGEPEYDSILTIVTQLDRAGYRLLLLFDEFDRVTRSSRFEPDFYAFLRSLAGHLRVAFITASSRDLQQLCASREISDSPFFNIFTTLPLGPLEPVEARALITEPTAASAFPLEPHADLIVDLAGHIPFFLQIACSATFEILVETGEAPRQAVEQRFLEEALPHFQFYWEQFDPVARSVCHDLASGTTPPPGKVLDDLVQRGFALGRDRLFSSSFASFACERYEREVGEEPVEVQAERARSLEGELDKAREMQMGLLPQADPEIRGFQIRGRLEPASRVAGDFYTYLWLDEAETQMGIVAADVMGHGMEGAVTALRFSETLRYEARGRLKPIEIMDGLNRALTTTLQEGYVGCCIAVIDTGTGEVTVTCGGYYAPLHYSRATGLVTEPQLGCLPLGISAGAVYESARLSLAPGDLLLIYSDGVVEARDDRDAEYGQQRLFELLQRSGGEELGASQLIELLMWDVTRFATSVGQADDITAIAVKALPG